MKPVKQDDFEDPEKFVAVLSEELRMTTPLALLLRGYQTSEQIFAVSNVTIKHIEDCAGSNARALLQLSHELVSLWLEPSPIGPMSTVIKLTKTQKLILEHLRDMNEEGLARFKDLIEDETAILTHPANAAPPKRFSTLCQKTQEADRQQATAARV